MSHRHVAASARRPRRRNRRVRQPRIRPRRWRSERRNRRARAGGGRSHRRRQSRRQPPALEAAAWRGAAGGAGPDAGADSRPRRPVERPAAGGAPAPAASTGSGGMTGTGGSGGMGVTGTTMFPRPGGTNLCPDPTLRITFSGAPTIGTAGKIQVFNAAQPATAVAVVDVGATAFTKTVGGMVFNIQRPVYIDGNTAVIVLPIAGARVRSNLLRHRRLRRDPGAGRRGVLGHRHHHLAFQHRGGRADESRGGQRRGRRQRPLLLGAGRDRLRARPTTPPRSPSPSPPAPITRSSTSPRRATSR